MTSKEAVNYLEQLGRDPVQAHKDSVAILVEFLASQGFGTVADAFRKAQKYIGLATDMPDPTDAATTQSEAEWISAMRSKTNAMRSKTTLMRLQTESLLKEASEISRQNDALYASLASSYASLASSVRP